MPDDLGSEGLQTACATCRAASIGALVRDRIGARARQLTLCGSPAARSAQEKHYHYGSLSRRHNDYGVGAMIPSPQPLRADLYTRFTARMLHWPHASHHG